MKKSDIPAIGTRDNARSDRAAVAYVRTDRVTRRGRRGAADLALEALEDRREYYEANEAELRELVNSIFLPRFDRNYAAYLVLGRHGRSTSAEDRARFTDWRFTTTF